MTAEEIELQPVVSPLEALQGRMAGVEVEQRSGMPGNAPIIRIRGRNSLREDGNYPLYILNGVPINSTPVSVGSLLNDGLDPLSTLDVSNIESIEVLKDADATAIYGSRGANGVVLITTKKGLGYGQKTQIEAQWYSGLGQVDRKMELLDTEQYIQMRRAAIANVDEVPDIATDWDLLQWDTNRHTDWQDTFFGGIAPINKINVSATGGNSNTFFSLSGSYHKQGTVFPTDINYHKMSSGLNLNHISENKKLGIVLSVNYGMDISDSYNVSNLIEQAYALPPNAPELYNGDGSLHWDKWVLAGLDNPLAGQFGPTMGRVQNMVANMGLSYKLLHGLTFKANMGATQFIREGKTKTFNDIVAPQRRDNTPHRASQNYHKRSSWILEPQLVYRKTSETGTLDGLIGATFQHNESDGFSISGQGFTSSSLVGYMPAAEVVTSGTNRNTEYRYNSVFGRLGYNWKTKYFINLTGRRDGSSRFGPNKRFADFWAIGGAWIFTEEPLVKDNISFLSFGKLRGSYGTTGNDQIGDYGYLDVYEATPAPNGLYPTRLFNADFAWEENKKMEFALNLGFLKERITLGANWYRNRSSNQLVGYPLPGMTGFATVQANLPATVQNTGWELELATSNISSKELSWNTFLNVNIPKNELLAFPELEQTAYANIYRVGHPLNIRLAYQFKGTDPESGLYQVLDINNDGSYDYQDRIVIKDLGRKFYGGITNNLTYKGIRLHFLWEFIKQNALRPSPFFNSYPGEKFNRSIEDYEAWQDGDLYVARSANSNTAYGLWRNSDLGIVDASFLRLKTISVSYDLPIGAAGIRNLRLFCSAQNIWTISNYPGVNLDDPGPATTLPALRTITTGIQIKF